MNTNVINEQQLQLDINSLKSQYSETKELYREACVLLFFRYGITPTANRLYQYVRKGSMSAPAEALNQFWAEIRDKSHVRIERADIPESLLLASGELISKLWNDAQKEAQENYYELIDNATSEIVKLKIEAETSNQKAHNLDDQLKNTEVELKGALNKASETDYLLQVNINTLTQRENQLSELKIEKEELTTSIKSLKESFSKDIEAIASSLSKAECVFC